MLIIGNKTVGKHFIRLEPGKDIIGRLDQYLSTMNGKWRPSTYSKSEGYKNPNFAMNYRRPKNLIGLAIVLWAIIKKYNEKIVDKVFNRY